MELNFWNRYFQRISFGEEFSEEECKNMFKKYGDKDSLVPYFFLYLFEKEKYLEKRNELINICVKYPTVILL